VDKPPKKRGRPAGERKTHTAVTIDPRMLETLKASALGVSEEIRRRVAVTLEADVYDEPTRHLATEIMRIAAEVECETGAAWHSHAGAWLAFRQAILARMKRLEPQGPTAFGERPHQSGPYDDPLEIGIWAEYQVFTETELGWSTEHRKFVRKMREKNHQDIVKLYREQQEGKEP
jgi:hypothetical protein